MDYAIVILTASLTSISCLLISVCLKLRAARGDLEVSKLELIMLTEEAERNLSILKTYRESKYRQIVKELEEIDTSVTLDSSPKLFDTSFKPLDSSFKPLDSSPPKPLDSSWDLSHPSTRN